ncbi:MAG: hypothetical protein A49_18060 [Methyloceanibacter sp.]|nr:MAG: hypothetical protein A49_18060 [Methyloceanibacter sp.]
MRGAAGLLSPMARRQGEGRLLGGLRRGRDSLRLGLEMTQSLGDFLWFWLKMFSKHIKASRDDTRNRP